MKKVFVLIMCVTAWGTTLFAQSGGAGVRLLDVESYSKLFLNGNGRITPKYTRAASNDDYEKIAPLDGKETSIDTPLEIALLSTCTGVVDVRPVEAVNMLGTAREADLKLGAAVYMEMQAARFLGSDPAPYAAALKFITDRGRVTEADIKSFVKQGIAAAVREKFNEISFRLENWSSSYAATLSYNPQTKEYTLSYGGRYTNDVVRKILGNGLGGLLAIMKESPDFDTYGIAQVKEQAELIPAVVYASWVDKKMTKVDAVKLAADTIANFYISPTNANYDLLVGVFGLFERDRGVTHDPVAEAGADAYRAAIGVLNEQLREKAGIDSLSKGTALARAARAQNPDYSVFTIPYK